MFPRLLFGAVKKVCRGINRQKKKNLRIKRATTDRILKEITQRAKVINAAPESQYMYYVSKILVFGRYSTPKERLGDIDVAVNIEGRWKTDKEYDRLLDAVCGKKVLGESKVLYPYQKIITVLRNWNKSLSFHPFEEIFRGKFPHKIIFERSSKIRKTEQNRRRSSVSIKSE